ncbi:hypothetical protein DSECCO2_455910 [anaerobic digester metagenome]
MRLQGMVDCITVENLMLPSLALVVQPFGKNLLASDFKSIPKNRLVLKEDDFELAWFVLGFFTKQEGFGRDVFTDLALLG